MAAAEKILKGLGYSASKPFEFDMWYTPSHYGDTEANMAEVLKAQIEKTPLVKVNLKSAEWATYKQQWKNKQMPRLPSWLVPGLRGPRQLHRGLCRYVRLQGNGIYFSDPRVGRPVHQGTDTTDDAVRKDLSRPMQKMWTDEVPTAPTFQGYLYSFSKKNVTGVKIGPTLIFNYKELTFTK